jgi:hypothetical protein
VRGGGKGEKDLETGRTEKEKEGKKQTREKIDGNVCCGRMENCGQINRQEVGREC